MKDNITYYPLTGAQKAVWMTEKLHPNTSINNVAGTLKIKEKVDIEILEKAINLFIEKNDSMRLRIIEIEGEPRQYLSEYNYINIEYIDFSQEDQNELYKWDSIQTRLPFKLIESDLFNFVILKLSDNEGGFYVKLHHLITDAWSMSLLGSRIMIYYSALMRGEAISEKEPSYIDYIINESGYYNTQRFIKDKQYWEKTFENFTGKTVLKPETENSGIRSSRVTMLTPQKLTDKIYRYCAENNASVFSLFIAALSMYISRVTSKEDIIIGTTTLNRLNPVEKATTGMFSNIAPLRVKVNGYMNFKELISDVTVNGMSMLRHQKYPYDLVLKQLRRDNNVSDSIFNIILIYQNTKFVKNNFTEDYTTRWHFNGYQVDSLHISVNDRECEGCLIIDYDYQTDLFHAKEIEFIHRNIINILWHALDNPAKKIYQLDMLPEGERHRILNDFNSTHIIYPNGVEKPFSNEANEILRRTKSYILDKNLCILPIGIQGDLYISGEGLKKEELDILGLSKTNAVIAPFINKTLIYKTCCKARWYPDGDILFVGREKNETQKINGRENNLKEKNEVYIVSTFTADPVGSFIDWWGEKMGIGLKTVFSGYNQVFRELLDSESSLSGRKNGFNVALIRFEDFIRYEHGKDDDKLLILENTYTDLKKAIIHFHSVIPFIFAIFTVSTGLGLSEMLIRRIEEITLEFADTLQKLDNVFVLKLDKLQNMYSIKDIFDETNDKLGHMPFSEEYYAALGTEIARNICSIQKQKYKVVVLDCDNTLWKGVCGEQGTLGVQVDDCFMQLQSFMKEKKNEGLLLAVCSKNNENDVRDVFENNPGMVLNSTDIISWRVDWNEKSLNIREIAKELNLGLDSFIFIDDSPLECSKMVESCPEVLTLLLPADEKLIPIFLQHIWALDRSNVTVEDAQRSNMYHDEKRRTEFRDSSISLESFLASLELKVSMRPIESNETARAAQMTQRTNQFNLSTIRREAWDIEKLLKNNSYKGFVIEARDRFGAYGTVGLVILAYNGDRLFLDTFLLSCRILGRNVEAAVMSGIRRYAQGLCIAEIDADFVPTAKNAPFLEFIKRSKWRIAEKTEKSARYTISTAELPESVDFIELYYSDTCELIEQEALQEASAAAETEKVDPSVFESRLTNYDQMIDDYSIDIIENKNNSLYLEPLRYMTGKKLMDIWKLSDKNNREYIQTENEIERILLCIWREVLQTNAIKPDDDFFKLGGDSLSAVILISRVKRELGVELTLKDIFLSSTISLLADKITSIDKGKFDRIEPVNALEYYQISSAQKRMFVLDSIDGNSTIYNECQRIEIKGDVKINRLQSAFRSFVDRHEVMRTGFEMMDEGPVQRVYNNVDFNIDYLEADEKEIDNIEKAFVKPFDLSEPPLLRALIVKISDLRHILLIDIHHIIIDGASFGILINEILAMYRGEKLKPQKLQYKDFTYWQNKFLETDEYKKQEGFWLDMLSGEIPVIDMPADHVRPAVQSFKGRKSSFTIRPDMVERLRHLCTNSGSTMFMLLFAAFNVLIYRYTGQEDIIIGTPVSGRRHPDTKNIVGLFINSLPIRTNPKGSIDFSAYLCQVKEVILACLENQDYQYDILINKLNVNRSVNRNPLFDIQFALRNTDMPEIRLDDLVITQRSIDNHKSKLDLSLFAVDNGDNIELSFEYSSDLFEQDTIEAMQRHFINILEDVCLNENKLLSEIEILDKDEKQRMIYEFNETHVDYQREKTVHELFEEQAEKTPDNTAVVFGDTKLTYKELNEKANQLARALRSKGVVSDTVAAVMIERSPIMIISILAILKAGGAYVPIDPEYPQERIRYMLDNSGAKLLLTQRSLSDKMYDEKNCVLVDEVEYEKYDCSDLENLSSPDDMIYLIYTSGSTGKPKGVMLLHRNITNFIKGMKDSIGFAPTDCVLCVTTISFDIFVLESWVPLSSGARIVLASHDEQLDMELLSEVIKKNDVSIVQMTPSRMKLICDDTGIKNVFGKVKTILLGGEPFPPELLRYLKKNTHARVYNMYGPTETAVWSSVMDLTHEDEISIGEPIDNTQLYILNQSLCPQPINVTGELYIAGDGVAKGYLNREDITMERFIPNPFIKGKLMYKTGDLVKRKPDGRVIFMGRSDDQVKIRGYRIELDEIKHCVMNYEGIKDTVVVAGKKSDNNDTLYLYFISEKKISVNDLREYMLEILPYYMVPSYLIQVSSFPYLANGKLDKKKLLTITADVEKDKAQDRSEPLSHEESVLLDCWKKVLGNSNITVHDNLFTIGGDSLSVIRIISELTKFTYMLKPQHIYNYPTVRELAAHLTEKEEQFVYNEFDYAKIRSDYNNFIAEEKLENNPFKNVLLTGATGFLGIHILSELLEQTAASVYCIVRGTKEKFRSRFIELLHFYFGEKYDLLIGRRIILINGDVSLKYFGLTEGLYEELGKRIDIVIHSAACVKHQGDYGEFERINVIGTKQIVEFSLKNCIKLGHISTLSISGDYVVRHKKPGIVFSENDLFVGQSYYENVYVRSKFEAENIVVKAQNEGLNAAIFRLGFVTGRYSDGRFQHNGEGNTYYNIIKAIIDVGIIPDAILSEEIDFSPVDICAGGIVKLLAKRQTMGRVIHHHNFNTIKIGDAKKIIEEVLNREIVTLNGINFEEFLQKARISGSSTDVDVIASTFNYEKILLNDEYRVKIDSKVSNVFESKIGIHWPIIGKEYISKVLNYMF